MDALGDLGCPGRPKKRVSSLTFLTARKEPRDCPLSEKWKLFSLFLLLPSCHEKLVTLEDYQLFSSLGRHRMEAVGITFSLSVSQ